MVLTLYKLDASPPVRAVRMVISALNIPDVEYVDINLLNGDHLQENYLKINPQHTIPTLKDDDFVIWDSHAIGPYLISQYGDNDSLYPKDPKKRAIIDQRLHFDSSILFPCAREAFKHIIFENEKSVRPEAVAGIKRGYDFMEKFLTSPWLAGDEVTLADISCIATISSTDVLAPVDSSVYPNLSAWMQRCSELDFYKKGNAPGLQAMRELLKMKLA